MRYGELWEDGDGDAHAAVQAAGTQEVAQLVRELQAVETPMLREAAAAIVRAANQTCGGRAALELVRDQGGPDLLVDVVQFAVDAPPFIVTPHDSLASAVYTRDRLGGQLVWRRNCGPWEPVIDGEVVGEEAEHRGS